MPLTMQFHPAGGMAGRVTCEHVIMHACTVKAKLFDCNDAQAEAVRALLEGRPQTREFAEIIWTVAGDGEVIVTRPALRSFPDWVVASGTWKALGRPSLDLFGVFAEIQAERECQDEQWGGPEHDDTHAPADWCEFIEHQCRASWSAAGADDRAAWRARMVKIAALAVAAIESHDRVMARGDKTGQPVDNNATPNLHTAALTEAMQAHRGKWPEELTSGVMFWRGERITRAEFDGVARNLAKDSA